MMEGRLQLKTKFIQNLLSTGQYPVSVYSFTQELGIEESEFYNHYPNFKSLELDIWNDFFVDTFEILSADENYVEYSLTEKWLSFLYTLVQNFAKQRSLILFRIENHKISDGKPWFLAKFKDSIDAYIKDILSQASEEEIHARPIVSNYYHEAFGIQILYILKVWTNDQSEDYQTTDAAIEKTTVLLFEMLKKGPLDLMIDFAKFAYQNRAW